MRSFRVRFFSRVTALGTVLGIALGVALAPHAPAWAQSTQPPLTPAGSLGFSLPPGFEATLFNTGIAHQRHIAASSEGIVFVIRRERVRGTGLVALKDTDGDGAADVQETFGRFAGSGIAVRTDADGQEWLYASSQTEIWRWPLAAGEITPSAKPQRMVYGFPRQIEHPYKPMTFDGQGGMYVMVGAPSNACMVRRRKKGSPGQDPCTQLARAAGVWRFDADTPDQLQTDGERYATGVRNMIAFTWSESQDALFGVQHGRDFLNRYFPEQFSRADGADLPSEEFHRIDEGDDLGWPYSYHDHIAGERRISPEYEAEDTPNRGRNRTDDYKLPLIGFPAHWAPSDIDFYEASAGESLFPERYRTGAFLVFKGGWGRNPNPPQEGFRVTFVPMENGEPAGEPEIFAGGFEGPQPPTSIGDAAYLPFSIAIGPEGEMYLSDTKLGHMWRITYTGATNASAEVAAASETEPVVAETAAAPSTADTRIAQAALEHPLGAEIYARECATCHQANGGGAPGFAPALAGSLIVSSDIQGLIAYTLLGANSGRYSNIMPAYLEETVSDEELAAALNYTRAAFTPDEAQDEGADAADFVATTATALDVAALRTRLTVSAPSNDAEDGDAGDDDANTGQETTP